MNILLKNIVNPNSHRIEEYIKVGGYKSVKKALKKMSPEEIINEVKYQALEVEEAQVFLQE